MASLPFSVLPAVARRFLRGSNLVRLSSIRYLVGRGRRAAPYPCEWTNESKAGGDKSDDGGAVATADCNESAIHERAESRVFEMGVGVKCRKWKNSASLSPLKHFRISISFAHRKSRTHAAIIGCEHVNSVHFDVDPPLLRSAVRKGRGGGAAVGIESLIGH